LYEKIGEKMNILKYKKGIIIGFIVGILSVPLALLGLGSIVGMIFYPLIIIPKIITQGLFGQSVISLAIVSIIIYLIIGFLIQYLYLRFKK
jgi:hypothetical protein